jgi:hypothetical protein
MNMNKHKFFLFSKKREIAVKFQQIKLSLGRRLYQNSVSFLGIVGDRS